MLMRKTFQKIYVSKSTYCHAVTLNIAFVSEYTTAKLTCSR